MKIEDKIDTIKKIINIYVEENKNNKQLLFVLKKPVYDPKVFIYNNKARLCYGAFMITIENTKLYALPLYKKYAEQVEILEKYIKERIKHYGKN